MSSGRAAPSAGECTTPLISIVIPVYNAEKYLAGCLDAIVSQAFQDIEIITVDGGSTDLSPEILAERVKSEPRLTIIRQDRIGPGRARNIGAAVPPAGTSGSWTPTTLLRRTACRRSPAAWKLTCRTCS